ncbi:MAG TPA: hypothetical protein VMV43_11175 [Candidatus Nanopelagicaceae bacterium]|jgi:hypothetical protein|nr:hypothetical protein [Candidatus Nanopelagicaceae bacterium]
MNEKEQEKSEPAGEAEYTERRSRRTRPARRPQGQALQEALNISPEELKDVEAKLSIIKFLDYFSEEPLDFAFKERTIDQYVQKMTEKIDKFGFGGEEDKLLKKGFEDKKILEAVNKIKDKTEELAISKGINRSVDKRLRRLNLLITGPLLAIAVMFFILPYFGIDIGTFIMLPLICVFCMVPQLVRNTVVKKWFQFKEETRNELYTKNRDDILVLKSYTAEVLANIRYNLLELKVPLELIKFSLYNRDYEDLNVINQKQLKGLTEYYVSFAYPEGMEPFPIPENLQQQYNQPIFPERKKRDKAEKNFIVLTEMKGKNGVISSFVPGLKDNLADKINQMLSDSEFSDADLEFSEIIPNYSTDAVIYCLCGEVAEISTVNVCRWKDKFNFYLFEGAQCQCGDNIYAISLMDEEDEVPEELQEIFLS